MEDGIAIGDWIDVEAQDGHVAYCHPRNASLIAAAPDLLEALDDCAFVLQSINDQLKGKSVAVVTVLEKARDAIEKAKNTKVE